jgi:NADPH-dependent curcumin reductase CurA
LKDSIKNFLKNVIFVKTMAIIERVFYNLGGAIADVVIFSTKPVASVAAIGCVTKYGGSAIKKFSKFATEIALNDKTEDNVSENLFKCLDYID